MRKYGVQSEETKKWNCLNHLIAMVVNAFTQHKNCLLYILFIYLYKLMHLKHKKIHLLIIMKTVYLIIIFPNNFF